MGCAIESCAHSSKVTITTESIPKYRFNPLQFYTICAVALERARKCQNAVIAASKIKIFSGVSKNRIAGHRNTIIYALKGL
jgi:hypothetical protein